MNHKLHLTSRGRRPALVGLFLASLSLAAAQSATAPAADAATLARFDRNKDGVIDASERRAMEAEMAVSGTDATAAEDPLQMSPFEVVGDTRGYYASNTMSGTRISSKLEDLGASITVMTKEQMADFAILDMNDVFLYANNTEGTGTYTEFSIDQGQGALTDATSGDPGNANRIRGIGKANVSLSNFETSNRVPLDPIDIDAVEINRGANASIFGLGEASGTVNMIGSKASLSKSHSTVSGRVDNFDGWRTSLDLNRQIIKNVLSVRASTVQQYDGFKLKPSGVYSQRYNAMVQYRPFKKTTINASYQDYRSHGNRPNSTPPMDGVSGWIGSGMHTWDPVTNTRHDATGASMGSGLLSSMYAASSNYAALYVEPDGSVPVWMTTWGTTTKAGSIPSPINDATQSTRKMPLSRALTQSSQPLIGTRVDMISDKSIYDWSRINLAYPNSFRDETQTARVTLDQIFFANRQQSLVLQLGYFREDSQRFQRYLLNDGVTAGPTGQLVIDINERLLDGSPNPGFLRPLIQASTPGDRQNPIRNKTYRAQMAYMVDFTGNKNFTKWFGWHGITGYNEYKERITRYFRYYDQIISRNPWMISSSTGKVMLHSRARPSFRWYVGDDQGFNVDYAPGRHSFGDYTFVWGDAAKSPAGSGMTREQVTLGRIASSSASGSLSIQKTLGGVIQSKFLGDRIVTTYGKRQDRHYTKFQNPVQTDETGIDFDYNYMTQWRDEDWQTREGNTENRGVVVRPFSNWRPIERLANQDGVVGLFGELINGFSVHYNESDSFKPASPAQNVYGEWLPDPSGFTKDYGFSISLLQNRLSLRVNKYRSEQNNSRSGPSAAFARRLWGIDYNDNNFGLQDIATEWILEMAAAEGRTVTPEQLKTELEATMGIPVREIPDSGTIATSETDDIVSTGHEIELHFNPSRNWTLMAAFNEKQTINTRLARSVSLYIAERMPWWNKIVDPRTGALWWDSRYNNYAETPHMYFNRIVGNPLQIATATEGLSRPQIRRYSGNLSTNYYLRGLTSNSILKGVNIGGSMRYESKGAIGYWAKQPPTEIMTEYDVTRPIYDKAHTYFDAFVGFRTPIWNDRIMGRFQLNVRNLTEGGRLQPLAAGPEGKLTAFRIVAPRQFIFTASFDL